MIRIAMRPALSKKERAVMTALPVLCAILASMIVLAFMSLNPFEVYGNIFAGCFGTFYRFKQVVYKAVPLTILSLGCCVAFKMKFWNIGAEGQFYMGAFASTWAYMLFPNLPAPILLPLMAFFAFVAGGLFSLIPAALKIKWGTSETLVTLMLNYVAQKWVSYLKYSYLPWRDPNGGGSPKIATFSDNAILPSLFGIHIGWLIAVILVVLMYFLLKKTKFGYEVSILGESMDTARYAGINVARTLIIAVVLSGGLCALAGMIQASAIEHSLTDNMSNGMGFTAVITTWLSQLDPLVALLVSFAFSVLLQGGSYLQTSMGVPDSMGTIIQTIIIFFVLGSEFFIRYRIYWEKKGGEK
ncbi:MAG: ABC transporter permease [Treponema sp.]|nr:ABC transporter permease [Treponema sp.]